MNTYIRNTMFLILLTVAVISLPACGSKNDIKSEKAPESVLNPEQAPVTASASSESSASSHVKKAHHTKMAQSTTTTAAPVSATAPTPAPAQPAPQVSMDTTTPIQKSGHFHWFLWLLVLLVLGAIGWYFWSKNQEETHTPPTQPMAPTGGLSPVSGFTAMKDGIEDEIEAKPSFWSKKIF